ncbi:hypothetical protein K6V33_05745 [Streptococcus suis]|nr:hypothetical protein [Streptococcus suis]
MIKKVRGTFLTLALKQESEAGPGDLFNPRLETRARQVRGTFLTLALKRESEAGPGDLFDANFVRSISSLLQSH